MALSAGRDSLLLDDRGRIAAALAPQLDLLLASGGGADIWPDPVSGRTPCGTTTRPAVHEIWFSSTSAQSIGLRAYDQTLLTFARLARKSPQAPLSPSFWLADVRAQIALKLAASNAQVLLAASVSEARDLARTIARLLLRRHIMEIAATPGESTDFSVRRREGMTCVQVDLRDEAGNPRDPADIDTEALQLSEASLESRNAVLLHLLDTSKTGLAGISRGVARAVQRAAPKRALALVDASEGRAHPGELKSALAQGMMTLVSGSHFVGGPPFCAALLLPSDIVAQLQEALDAAGASDDLASVSCLTSALNGASPINLGLALRWSAALSEIDDYSACDDALRRQTLEVFARKARALAARRIFLSVEATAPGADDDPWRDSIVTLFPLVPQGPSRACEYAAAIQKALAETGGDDLNAAACHVGSPIAIGNRAALTVSASAPMVSGVARRMEMGLSFERAMAPVLRDLQTLFGKWEALAG